MPKWSYKDSQGAVHHHVSVENMRKAINAGEISPSSLVKNTHLSEQWIPAIETTFFLESKQHLPQSKNANKTFQTPSNIPPPGSAAVKRKSVNATAAVLFFLICLLPLGSLATVSTFIYIHHADKQKYLVLLQAEIKDFSLTLHPSDTLSDWQQKEMLRLNDEKNFITENIASFALIPETTPYRSFFNKSDEEMNKYLRWAPYASLSMLLPYLIGLIHYSKSVRLTHQRGVIPIAFLHSLPILNVIFYSYISARWNLEGTQRKNNLLLTFPLSAALLVCIGITTMYYMKQTHHWPSIATICVLLWTILHIRQIQMLSYAQSRPNQVFT